MSAIATDSGLWVTAGWVKAHLHVNETKMLRLVAQGTVTVRLVNGKDPLYSANDVIAWCKENGRNVSMPEIIDRNAAMARRKRTAAR